LRRRHEPRAVMVHKYSPDALIRRRDRAYNLGFLVAKPSGTDLVCVPHVVAARTRTMAQSLVVHDRHDAVCGQHSHFARNATFHAKPHVSEDEFAFASSLHKKANAAKHGGLSKTMPPPPFRMDDTSWIHGTVQIAAVETLAATTVPQNNTLAATELPHKINKPLNKTFELLHKTHEPKSATLEPQDITIAANELLNKIFELHNKTFELLNKTLKLKSTTLEPQNNPSAAFVLLNKTVSLEPKSATIEPLDSTTAAFELLNKTNKPVNKTSELLDKTLEPNSATFEPLDSTTAAFELLSKIYEMQNTTHKIFAARELPIKILEPLNETNEQQTATLEPPYTTLAATELPNKTFLPHSEPDLLEVRFANDNIAQSLIVRDNLRQMYISNAKIFNKHLIAAALPIAVFAPLDSPLEVVKNSAAVALLPATPEPLNKIMPVVVPTEVLQVFTAFELSKTVPAAVRPKRPRKRHKPTLGTNANTMVTEVTVATVAAEVSAETVSTSSTEYIQLYNRYAAFADDVPDAESSADSQPDPEPPHFCEFCLADCGIEYYFDMIKEEFHCGDCHMGCLYDCMLCSSNAHRLNAR
jgi:hypothetical protein